ncbi:MAG: (deoxy)nucleoside triphosphate pyrophosphohydrolase [archaeon]
MTMEELTVTAAIIEKDGKYLITQRPDDGRSNAGRWEFPGGTVEPDEDLEGNLKKEMFEEAGMNVKVGDRFEKSAHVYGKTRHVELVAFHCKYVSGDIQKKDILDFAWVTPQEMDKYDITEADLPFVEKLKTLEK